MTAPALSTAEAQRIYRAALLDARLNGYVLGQQVLARIKRVFESAARSVVARTRAGLMTQKRADELLDSLEYALLDIERGTVQGVIGSVRVAIDRTTVILRTATEELLPGTAELTARFNQVPVRAIAALYGKPRMEWPIRTLVRRHMEFIEPQMRDMLAKGMAIGLDTREMAKQLQALMLGDDEQLRLKLGMDPSEVAAMRSLWSDVKMIARSEVANALREATAQSMTESRIVQAAKWQTSGNHQIEDECDELAEEDVGYGPGYYPPEDWPDAPHPNCACYAGDVHLRPVDQWGLERQPPPTKPMPAEDEPLFADPDLPPHSVVYTDLDEIAREMERRFDVQVDFAIPDQTPLWAVNDWMRVWEGLARAGYPLPKAAQWTIRAQFIADYNWFENDMMSFNIAHEMWKSPEAWDAQVASSFKNHWWTNNSPLDLYAHEYGHWYHAQHMRNFFGPRADTDTQFRAPWDMSPAAKQWMKWKYWDTFGEEAKVLQDVGEYGSHDPAEFVAEMFDGLTHGKTYPARMMKLYEDYYGPPILPVKLP